jgi:hypothetical protein
MIIVYVTGKTRPVTGKTAFCNTHVFPVTKSEIIGKSFSKNISILHSSE